MKCRSCGSPTKTQPSNGALRDTARTGTVFFEIRPFTFPEPDLAALNDETLGIAVMEAFRQGVAGYARDVFVHGRPWPFDPGRITAPVLVIHGELDNVVPIAHSRHTADLIPSSTFRVLPGHGHLSTLTELPAMAAAMGGV